MTDKADQLDPTLWKPGADARAVITALGGDGTARFVGGCVRNTLLNRARGDWDIATINTPAEVINRLQQAGIRVVPTGIAHGTVTAVVEGTGFEITTLRRDVETDGRHAVVAFTTDWAEDAQRRDFTMNTLLADLAGNVYDPTGRGLADLRAGRVAFVGKPEQRIAEDALRILRFFRFHALYGRGEPDPAALEACRAAAEKVSTLSRERITQEMLKILGIEAPGAILGVMRDNRIMPELFHPDFYSAGLDALDGLQRRIGAVSIEARIAVLCAADPKHLAGMEKYLLFTNAQRRVLETIFAAVPTRTGIRERLYRYGRVAGGQSAAVLAALGAVRLSDGDVEDIRAWPIPVLPVNGEDLKAAGLAPGPGMGEMLRRIENWWVGENFMPDAAACREKLKTLVR